MSQVQKGNYAKAQILAGKKPSQGLASGFDPCEGFYMP
jgi:hypothetical protein